MLRFLKKSKSLSFTPRSASTPESDIPEHPDLVELPNIVPTDEELEAKIEAAETRRKLIKRHKTTLATVWNEDLIQTYKEELRKHHENDSWNTHNDDIIEFWTERLDELPPIRTLPYHPQSLLQFLRLPLPTTISSTFTP